MPPATYLMQTHQRQHRAGRTRSQSVDSSPRPQHPDPRLLTHERQQCVASGGRAQASSSWSLLVNVLFTRCCYWLDCASLLSLRCVSRRWSLLSSERNAWEEVQLTWKEWVTLTTSPAVADKVIVHAQVSYPSVFPLDMRHVSLYNHNLLPFHLPYLTSYSLRHSPIAIQNAAMHFLPYCRYLHCLDLSYCDAVDTGALSMLYHLPIHTLNLSHCTRVDDSTTRVIAKMNKLTAINLQGTQVTQRGVHKVILTVSLLLLAASPTRWGYFLILPELLQLVSLSLHLADCDATTFQNTGGDRALLHNNLCLHALSQLSPRLRRLQLTGVSHFIQTMKKQHKQGISLSSSSSCCIPKQTDWLLFFSAFTQLHTLQLADLMSGGNDLLLFNDSFCSQLFPYLASELQVLELIFEAPNRDRDTDQQETQSLNVDTDSLSWYWEGDYDGEEIWWDPTDSSCVRGSSASSAPVVPSPPVVSSTSTFCVSLPVSVFFCLPRLYALSLHFVDFSLSSSKDWQMLPQRLPCLMALELNLCEHIESWPANSRLQFYTVHSLERNTDVSNHALPPYFEYAAQRDAFNRQAKQATQWQRQIAQQQTVT